MKTLFAIILIAFSVSLLTSSTEAAKQKKSGYKLDSKQIERVSREINFER